MIDTNAAFILFANCDVLYDGRAQSTLETGNYLIIRKSDGSLQIQAGSKIAPRNYQSPGAIIEQRGHILISRRKSETITIIIHKLFEIFYPNNWSLAETMISKTEKELVDKLINNWSVYIKSNDVEIYREFQTTLGPVDVVGIEKDSDHFHVVEVKRKTISIPNISQLNRYVTAIKDTDPDYKPLVTGYIASPKIGDRAAKYCESLGFSYIRLEF